MELPELDVSDEPDVLGVAELPLLDDEPLPEEPEVLGLDGLALLDDEPLPEEPEDPGPEVPELGVVELPVPDDPDVPESFFSVSVVPVVPDPAAPVPVVAEPVADPAPDVESVDPVEEEPDPPALEPDVLVPVELGLGVVELGVVESVALGLLVPAPAALDGVVPVVRLFCSPDFPHPANRTLNTPAASKTFVVCIVDLIILFLSQKLSTHCLDCIA